MHTTKFYLIRHGESTWNVENRVQGHQDAPLTERGRLQAQAVAQRLKTVPFDIIYSSDLQRAAHTAHEIALASGNAEVIRTPHLREACWGEAEGMTRDEREAKYRAERERLDALYPEFLERWKHIEVPGAETHHALWERINNMLKSIAQAHRGGNVAVVTHGRVIRTVLTVLEVQEKVTLDNCCVVQLKHHHREDEIVFSFEAFELLDIRVTDNCVD